MSPFIGDFERSSFSIHFSRHKLLPNYNVKRALLVPFHHTPYGDCTVIALFFWYLITWIFLNVSQLRGSKASRIQSSPALRERHGNRCQSMSLKTVVLWLSIDHRLTNINWYQLSNWNQLLSIDWLVFRSSILIDCTHWMILTKHTFIFIFRDMIDYGS